jgi:hypothetical protein
MLSVSKKKMAALVAVPALALTLGLSACGDDSDPESAATGTTMTAPAAAPSVSAPAADLRVTLDRLLGEHAHLAIFAMQKGVDGDPDFEAVAGGLEENTVALGDAIGSVYGEDARAGFLKMWREHIGFFVDYTVATAEGDEQGREAALGKLAGYRASFSQFLAGANPNLTASGVSGLLQQHVDQLTTALDTYKAGDYAAAYRQVHAAHDHMSMTGDALAGAIATQFPDKFPAGEVTPAAAELRVALDKLLAEHASLAVFAMQKGADGAPDFDAIAGSLEENTVALGGAIGSVYGDEAETAFLRMWRQHIGFFVDYTVATAMDDEAGREAALDKLAGYRAEFSQFLAGANPNLTADGVSSLLQEHVNQLTGALDTYKAGDYAAAYEQLRSSYEHMFMTGDALAGAIVQQSPEKFAAQ